MSLRTAVKSAAPAAWQPVSSSNLQAVAYDEARHALSIRFKGGGTYEYYNVPQSVYRALLGASSKGKYFHANIKNGYRWKKTA